MEVKTEDANCAIALGSAKECVGENKVGILNPENRDADSDNINQAVETRKIISCVKPEILSRLKSVAAGAA